MPIISCFNEKPGPEVAVIAFAPPSEAPSTVPMPASSSSVCMNFPPTCGRRFAMPSAISVDGVIGYPP